MTREMHSFKSFEKQMLNLDWNVNTLLGETPVKDKFKIERDTTEKQQFSSLCQKSTKL